jgi:cryptochrome
MAAIHWFRKGLRLHDNPALLDACRAAGAHGVYPVFVLDPRFADPDRVGVVRYRFLLEALQDLHTRLQARGNRLYVVRGRPEEALPALFEPWGVKTLTFESDTEPFASVRDEAVTRAAHARGVAVRTHGTHTLHPPGAYFRQCEGGARGFPTGTYAAFLKLFAKVGAVPPAVEAPSAVPPPPAAAAAPSDGAGPTRAVPGGAGAGAGSSGGGSGSASGSGGADGDPFRVPSLEELGYPVPPSPSKVSLS